MQKTWPPKVRFGKQGQGAVAAGALAGTALTKALQKIVNDVAHRHLSDREKKRIGAGLAFALQKISDYLAAGRTIREDGFFDKDTTGRSASDEILEGVLLKCKNESEEKKLRLFGNIYADLAFMPEVSVKGANWLLQKAQQLTFRQLCMISIIQQKEHKGVSWGPNDGDPAFEMEYRQIEDLITRDSSRDAIKQEQEVGTARPLTGLSRAGRLLFNLMGLDEISEEDLRKLAPRFPRAFAQ